VTPAASLLAAEIRAGGPIPFSRFMEVALYHPEHGYYRSARDPFGIRGDFYTAAQLQPVFGRLAASWVRRLRSQLGDPPAFTVVDWGAGRGEMAPYFEEFVYCPVDFARGSAPPRFTGVVFANELFDALPVDVVRLRGDSVVERRVAWDGRSFTWIDGPEPSAAWHSYIDAHRRNLPDGEGVLELPVRLRPTLQAMAAPLERGFVLAIDYGYTAREILRHPRGTLMSYRRHQASEDVLRDPGERDITAHVPFTFFCDSASALSLEASPLVTLQRALLDAGEPDHFASALAARDESEASRLRLQLKTLLFSLGESFRCALFSRL
jgi:SAM-dependent MidA family methyltransferase